MSSRRDLRLIEVRADLIVANRRSLDAYGHHFEAQFRRHYQIRRLLLASCLQILRTLEPLADSGPWPIW